MKDALRLVVFRLWYQAAMMVLAICVVGFSPSLVYAQAGLVPTTAVAFDDLDAPADPGDETGQQMNVLTDVAAQDGVYSDGWHSIERYYATGNSRVYPDAISLEFDTSGTITATALVLRAYLRKGAYVNTDWEYYQLLPGTFNPTNEDYDASTRPPGATDHILGGELPSNEVVGWVELPVHNAPDPGTGILGLTLRLWNWSVDAVELSTASLSGSITLADKGPGQYQDTIVEILEQGQDVVVASTQTDASGEFSLVIPAGTYRVQASHNGYFPLVLSSIVSPSVVPAQELQPIAQPGWPIAMGAGVNSDMAIANLDADADLEVVFGTMDGKLHALNPDGTSATSWPIVLSGNVIGAPAVADLDHDGDVEIAVLTTSGNGYVVSTSGSILPGWPVTIPSSYVGTENERPSPVLHNLDSDPELEILLTGSSALYVFDLNGVAWGGNWPVSLPGIYGLAATPAIADLDGDSQVEIVACARSVWTGTVSVFELDGTPMPSWTPFNPGNYINASPVIVDLDRDGALEVVVCGEYNDNRIYLLDATGQSKPGWPVNVKRHQSSPAIGDVDGDGQWEIVVASRDDADSATEGWIYSVNHDGSVATSFPVQVAGFFDTSAPVLGDFSGDGVPDIMAGNLNGNLYMVDGAGLFLLGGTYSTSGPIYSTPALGDIDGDGQLECAFGSSDGSVYCLDFGPGSYMPSSLHYPTHHYNNARTGYVPGTSPTLAAMLLRDDDLANSPSIGFTNGQTVDVFFAGESADVTEMWLSESPLFSSGGWAPYSNPTSYTFATGIEEAKTVYAKVRNGIGYQAGTGGGIYASITLDVTSPTLFSSADTRPVDQDSTPALYVTFDEPVVYGVYDPGNYVILGPSDPTSNPPTSVTVQLVTYMGANRYELATNDQVIGMPYSVEVSTVSDRAGNPVDPASNTSIWTGVPVAISRFDLD